MAGGLLQIQAVGQVNAILTGNPSKSFFKSVFHQYTNFALQKFTLNFEGAKTLRLSEETTFTFKVKRYADLLMDTYLAVYLPNIWSPILPPQPVVDGSLGNTEQWAPYEFKWIKNLGAKMISKIAITCGNYTLQEYSGDYLLSAVQRDFSADKKALFDIMIGNIPEMYDPANANTRINTYPSAYYDKSPSGPEPSIRGRTIYVPLNAWFGFKSQMAFPLISLQYNELQIVVTLRPLCELFTIRDVFDATNNYPYIAPNFNQWYMQFHRFLQPPPNVELTAESYIDQRSTWNSNICLNATYCFLSKDEQRKFALTEGSYLIKQISQKFFPNVTGPKKVKIETSGLVSSWMFYFQRSDVNLRNEWSNYTNYPYDYIPINVKYAETAATEDTGYSVAQINSEGNIVYSYIGAGVNPDGTLTGILTTPTYDPQNDREILVAMGILLDGTYRENIQPVGVYNYIEKYIRTTGNAPDGLYCYNFCLHSNSADLQPSGAINMSRFTQIELEFTTIIPPLDPYAQSLTICDPLTGNVIGINKPTWRIFDYNFDLTLIEEKINIISFAGGNVGLLYAT